MFMFFPPLTSSRTIENESSGLSSKNEGHSVQQDAQLIQPSRSIVTFGMIRDTQLHLFKLQGLHPRLLFHFTKYLRMPK